VDRKLDLALSLINECMDATRGKDLPTLQVQNVLDVCKREINEQSSKEFLNLFLIF